MTEQDLKFYTCRYDVAFKEVFMNEKNKELLIYLLEKILDTKILDVSYLNLERNVSNVHVKRKHFDLNLKTEVGYIQVEVNASKRDYTYPRNMAYICDTYANHVLRGMDYSELTKIIQINFSYGVDSERLYSVYNVSDESGKRFVSNFVIYEFYMDKYKELWYNEDKKLIEDNKHIIMLDLDLGELKKLSNKDKVVDYYMDELERVNKDPEFREFMSAEEDNRKIENSLMKQWKREGLEEGRKEGLERGMAEAKREIAIKLYSSGMDLNKISEILDIPCSEVEKNISK